MMKKRIFSLLLALVLCLSLTTVAFAGNASCTKYTSGGSKGKLKVYCDLQVDIHVATATTKIPGDSSVRPVTFVDYFYYSSTGNGRSSDDEGVFSASTGNGYASGYRAESRHQIKDTSYGWGTYDQWLYADAY